MNLSSVEWLRGEESSLYALAEADGYSRTPESSVQYGAVPTTLDLVVMSVRTYPSAELVS